MSIRHKIRDDVARTLRQHIDKALATPGGAVVSCLSCAEFDEPNEQCRKHSARPPARIIAFGCPDYFDFDEIPF